MILHLFDSTVHSTHMYSTVKSFSFSKDINPKYFKTRQSCTDHPKDKALQQIKIRANTYDFNWVLNIVIRDVINNLRQAPCFMLQYFKSSCCCMLAVGIRFIGMAKKAAFHFHRIDIGTTLSSESIWAESVRLSGGYCQHSVRIFALRGRGASGRVCAQTRRSCRLK